MIDRLKGLNVIVETTKNSKIFGTIQDIDNSPDGFKWIIIKDRLNKEQWIKDNEIVRIEVNDE